jgi:HSP20 family molecular chaperone IbpA
MTERKEVATSQTQELAQQSGGQLARQPREFVLPRVDVHEDAMGITLTADLPGVTSERLNLQVDKNTLLIEGEAALALPKDMQAHYAEVRNPLYRRSFTLSSELDTEAIQANMKDGVLTLRLPKKAAYQPRKIQVQVA